MKSRAQRRHDDWSKAVRKQQISVHNYGFEYYDNLHAYSKNKIHCSCPLCRSKTGNKGRKHSWAPVKNWPVSDLKRIGEMKDEEKDFEEGGDFMALDRSKVKVEVVEVKPFANDHAHGFTFVWDSNIGFGEYTLYQYARKDMDGGMWHADSECMDTTEDPWFLRLLLDDFVNNRLTID